jgi:hypothetical protein
MPTIVTDAGVEVEVSASTFQRMVDGDRIVQTATQTSGNRVALWDGVDQQWTSPLAQGSISHYLKKTVFRCSACAFASMWHGDSGNHIQRVFESGRLHKDAHIESFEQEGYQWQRCTACNVSFRARHDAGTKHLASINDAVPLHIGAVEQLIQRFSLAEILPTTLRSWPVSGVPSVSVVEPLAEAERSDRHRRRRRRRSNKGTVNK